MTALLRTLAAVMLVTAAGCAPVPQQSDPAKAKAALTAALDAWKAGLPIDAHRQANPELTVVEPRWQPGTKLLEYEVAGDGKPSGWDQLFHVKLSLQTGDGKKVSEKAMYTVSTAPKLVVVRTEPNG